ncbi:molybdopterin-guanine dinucleotide biosynthesis protein B [Pullulanibacillus sp. KACC 23026]|uniref:molybdopterin-guanine dinucleotide biosynthesis protein B n=1 Tax=Pullulanibacillus sp. KACC 23026 TaxID=3028315 RepID=UPI0023B1924E|nr:molybdopterin-guanine dinucleotide biosynthesis protein B [Pullulanibacillus sp. KACC 23026]WEG11937.1 molybdopterin-guanine dinucleotide biosynthesis protein B [Pullulanibacillus sp. KACC 23026]
MTLNICQIVGYKNSGKTTLMSRLIETMKKQGNHVAALKHHGHEELDPMRNGDSGSHLSAGALVSGVISPFFAHFSYEQEPPLKAFIAFYEQIDRVDWLFIEGYKEASYPKLVVAASLQDWQALSRLSQIKAVITDNQELKADMKGCLPVFSRGELSKIVAFLEKGAFLSPNK